MSQKYVLKICERVPG